LESWSRLSDEEEAFDCGVKCFTSQSTIAGIKD
jgi:hypothetical protein